jgi:hypothetical protein
MVLAGALGLASVGAAFAQAPAPQPQMQGEPSAAVRHACAADVKTLCPTARPGGGEIKACLRQNAAKLSAPCKQALLAAHAERKSGAGGAPMGQ